MGKLWVLPRQSVCWLIGFFPFSNFDLVFFFPLSPVPSHHTLPAAPPSNVFLNLFCCFLNLSVSSSESCGHGEQIPPPFFAAGFHIVERYHHDPYFLFFWLSSSSFCFFFFPPRCHVFLILWCSCCFCLDSFQLIFSEICWRLDIVLCWKLYQPQVEQNLLHNSHICSSIRSCMVFASFSTKNFPVSKTCFEFSLPASWQL